jgi:hypothetical protein
MASPATVPPQIKTPFVSLFVREMLTTNVDKLLVGLHTLAFVASVVARVIEYMLLMSTVPRIMVRPCLSTVNTISTQLCQDNQTAS